MPGVRLDKIASDLGKVTAVSSAECRHFFFEAATIQILDTKEIMTDCKYSVNIL
jgi:hypothetical protein